MELPAPDTVAGAAPALPSESDILIVGAGIAGLCTGLYLARAGREVVILDRAEPWGDASGANAGTISLQVKRPEVLEMTRAAIALWREFGEVLGIDVGLVEEGGLRVATSAADVANLRRSVALQQARGLEVELWEGGTLRDAAPWLGAAVRAASHCRSDCYSSPLVAGHNLIRAAAAAGARVVAHAAVEAIETEASGYRVSSAAGALRCRHLVIAAGAWSGRIAGLLGVALPVMVDVNMLTVTEPAPRLLDKIVTHIGGILSLKQYPNGTCMIGGAWQGRGGLESGAKELDYERLLHNLRLAAAVVPALAELRVVRSWAGFEAVAPDALPLLGRLPGHRHAFIAACARGGYSQGPAFGRLLAELIEGRPTSLAIERFDPGRFQS